MLAATLEARYPRQAESLPTASAAGQGWLPAEDRILATSVSLSTMARLTGRTYWPSSVGAGTSVSATPTTSSPTTRAPCSAHVPPWTASTKTGVPLAEFCKSPRPWVHRGRGPSSYSRSKI